MQKSYRSYLSEDAPEQDPVVTRLGRAMALHSVPVIDVAITLNLSRSVIYKWFQGKRPADRLRPAILRYCEALEALPVYSEAGSEVEPEPDLGIDLNTSF
jgi:hypothetical protein